MGRKIGVVQEIVCRKLLLQSQRLRDSVIFEPWLKGASGADHKVEFVFFQPRLALNFTTGQAQTVKGLAMTLVKSEQNRATFRLATSGMLVRKSVSLHGIIKPHALGLKADQDTVIKLSELKPNSARLVFLNPNDVRASVESKRVGAQRFSASEKLGSGIQTIEKAKQTSLVAIDADLKFNGTIKALARPKARRRYISFVVLGNGVHWTEKDKAILRTYVDYAFLIRDASIIRYLKYVKEKADKAGVEFREFLMMYFKGMTKTAPDDFQVSVGDFQVISPKSETRSMNKILEQHIGTYPAR